MKFWVNFFNNPICFLLKMFARLEYLCTHLLFKQIDAKQEHLKLRSNSPCNKVALSRLKIVQD